MNFWAHENASHENYPSNEADVKYCEQLHGIRAKLLSNAGVGVLQNKQLEVTNAYYKFIIEKQGMLGYIDESQFFGEKQTQCYNDLLARLEEAIQRISLESAIEGISLESAPPGNPDSIVPDTQGSGSDNEYNDEYEEQVVPDRNIDISIEDADTSIDININGQIEGSGSDFEIESESEIGSESDSGNEFEYAPDSYIQHDIEGPDRT